VRGYSTVLCTGFVKKCRRFIHWLYHCMYYVGDVSCNISQYSVMEEISFLKIENECQNVHENSKQFVMQIYPSVE